MKIRLTQIDGALPNLALMKLAHWHRAQGHSVVLTRVAGREAHEPDYDVVYGSTIFKFSEDKLTRFLRAWPKAVVGGTGTQSNATVESLLGVPEYEFYDYTDVPWFEPSLGFSQRGCRLSCKFCVVPQKEGKPRAVNTIYDIWRGDGHPKKIHLLDNDFFGQPRESWQARLKEARDGKFKLCFNQGLNIRLIDQESAEALADTEYRDADFQKRTLYTAWDNLKDEAIFFRGVETLEKAGVPPKHLRVYMLVGFDKNETMERVFYRFQKMVEAGVQPYPMVFDCRSKDAKRYRELKQFQRWVVTGLYRAVPFSEYDSAKKAKR
jgi:hypothetical protein